ncbi:uncharacterized protein [Arachis hypogaea]|uniref:uncharacterized protein n=1 Tax=Arachis hypogaea TaxID=3818 RepID=UPI003B222B2B
MTPYKALYGRDPPSLVKYEITPNHDHSLQELLLERDPLLDQLKVNMNYAQQSMKAFADRKRRQGELVVGYLVLVKLQPYRQHSVALRKNQKLEMRYFGSFKIVHKVSPVTYKLKLPNKAKIHDVFHISLLKKFKGDGKLPYLPMPLKTTKGGLVVFPTGILVKRTIVQGGRELQQLLVQ